ncbi:MAG: hypothetical protein ABIJ85_05010 [bacterium]
MNKKIIKKQLINLYVSGKSMAEIATFLNCSIHKIEYWMEKYGIKRRSRSEATYIKRNPDGDPFKIKTKLSKDDKFLFGLGIGIYWGEGTKVSKHSLRVANTDPGIIKAFVKFLTEICQLRRDKISYSIICFNDTDPNIARNFWAQELKISPDKFGKITQIPKQGKGTYKKKSLYGVCTVRASNIKLRNWLMSKIKLTRDVISPD